MERLAAEEYERERVRVSRNQPAIDLNFEPSEAWPPSSSRSSTPSSFASQEDAEAELEAETPTAVPCTPPETGRIAENHVRCIDLSMRTWMIDY